MIARMNPRCGDVESFEVLFFSTRLLRSELFELPVSAELGWHVGHSPALQRGRLGNSGRP